MDDMFKQALELVKAQATVRAMTVDEMTSMVGTLARSLQALSQDPAGAVAAESAPVPKGDVAKAIRESAVTCLECGKVCKIITAKHLALHGLDADAYREKWGIKEGTPLACKSLVRARRKKMKEMQLWERRKSAVGAKLKAEEAAPAAGMVAQAAPGKPKAKGRPKKA
ncbi:MucR family transcriptional regulator [Nitratidesulfovibrio sp.]|uniref:MucR family transcriptional regulator n=1 Tax=Nitratidesulfovibrio sp. TaxID=2802297 RepID=UPI0033420E05